MIQSHPLEQAADRLARGRKTSLVVLRRKEDVSPMSLQERREVRLESP